MSQYLVREVLAARKWARYFKTIYEKTVVAYSKVIDCYTDRVETLEGEIAEDVLKDHGEEIIEAIWVHFKKDFTRGLTRGMPAWYKRKLAEDFVK